MCSNAGRVIQDDRSTSGFIDLYKRGCFVLDYYCMTNELSLPGWGKLREDLPKFRDYRKEIYAGLKKRNLDIALLATDASPIERWDTIKWAAENMDDISGVYGRHHYVNDYPPSDLSFYPWFL